MDTKKRASHEVIKDTNKTYQELAEFLAKFYVTFVHLAEERETITDFAEMANCLNTLALHHGVDTPAEVVKSLGMLLVPFATEQDVMNAYNIMGIEYKLNDSVSCGIVLRMRPYVKKLLSFGLPVAN